jgi:hypothetical protein
MAWLSVLALGGCGYGPAPHLVRYVGPLPSCGLATATLARQGPGFAFSPGDGVLSIQGAVAADGGFSGTLNTQAPDKPAFLLTVSGRIAEDSATIDYATPRCRAHAVLARVTPPVF